MKLFSKFPREMGFPNRSGNGRIAYNKKDFINIINKFNGKTNLYTTVYAFEKIDNGVPDYNSAIIDKLFFDLDSVNAYENVKKLQAYCEKNNYDYNINFSGGGYHFYIKAKDYENLKNKKGALTNAQLKVLNDCKLTYGDAKTKDIDSAVIGDIARITRIPNTLNLKHRKYCVPIAYLVFNYGDEYIRNEWSKKPQIVDNSQNIYDAISLKEFDREAEKIIEDTQSPTILNEINDKILQSLPPCVQYCLTHHTDHRKRYMTAVYLKLNGFSEEENRALFNKYLSEFKRDDGTINDYVHMDKHDHVFETLYHKNKIHYFPHCDTIKNSGICPGDCQFKDKQYL